MTASADTLTSFPLGQDEIHQRLASYLELLGVAHETSLEMATLAIASETRTPVTIETAFDHLDTLLAQRFDGKTAIEAKVKVAYGVDHHRDLTQRAWSMPYGNRIKMMPKDHAPRFVKALKDLLKPGRTWV